MHEIESYMYRNDPEGIQSHEKHQSSSLAYLPPKVAIAVLRFPPRISLIFVTGYAQKCLRTHRWPLGLVFNLIPHFWNLKKNWLPSDGRTDGPSDGWTHPLIEMQGRI